MKRINLTILITLLTLSVFSQVHDTGDKVGIGTTNPTTKLDIMGSLRVGSDSEHVFQITDDPANNLIQLATSQRYTNLVPRNILFRSYGSSSNSSLLFMDAVSGHIGIGTLNPNRALHLVTDGNSVARFESTDNQTDANTAFLLNVGGTSRALIKWSMVGNSSYQSGLSFGVRGSDGLLDRMHITGDGYVGIGTTSPTHKLEVNGTIRSKEVKVEANNWPDYVFEEDYDLTSLEEIEAFIQSEKHLPEVPSAAEMEANGVQLGEMNMLLLKKIEELTLHMIEMKKENEEQRKRIEELEKNQK